MKNLKYLSLLIVAVSVFAGCEKEGEPGPAGPAGPQGNANVKTVIFTNQSFAFNATANVYQIVQGSTDITAAIVANGSVTAYIAKANNSNSNWTALPGDFTPDPAVPGQSRFFNFSYSENSATVYTATNPGYNVDVKFVIVAGQ